MKHKILEKIWPWEIIIIILGSPQVHFLFKRTSEIKVNHNYLNTILYKLHKSKYVNTFFLVIDETREDLLKKHGIRILILRVFEATFHCRWRCEGILEHVFSSNRKILQFWHEKRQKMMYKRRWYDDLNWNPSRSYCHFTRKIIISCYKYSNVY